MSRVVFLANIEASLKGNLPDNEIGEIIKDYTEYFAAGTEEGKSEKELEEEFGSAELIAKELLQDRQISSKSINISMFLNKKNLIKIISGILFLIYVFYLYNFKYK
ncbi:MAG TPA: DUF1700 domain-containing protein [Clostridia bacterium]|nr:DUF1700 domain-containing protein [Clostridia bacterium]